MSWHADTLSKLVARNRAEVRPFEALMSAHALALDKALVLTQENQKLSFQVEQLRALRAEGQDNAGLSGASGQEVSELKSKLAKAQEELVELLKRRGQNAQQVIDLTSRVKEQEDEINEKAAMLARNQEDIENLRLELGRLKEVARELEETNQLLKDEHQTLNLAMNTAENKLTEVQKENAKLIEMVMVYKNKEVEYMDRENAEFCRRKAEKVKLQLEEAAREQTKTVKTPG